ncbi:MAG: FAD:protein FMN transferase [Bacteroidota bacterium]
MNSFEHPAMATHYHLNFIEDENVYADSMAKECFNRIDELETKLSRFIPDSDISRINAMKADQELMIDIETYECLKMAIEINQWTNGAFDIGVGEFMNIFRGYKEGILTLSEQKNALKQALEEKVAGSIYLDPEEHKIYCIKPGIKFDLGALGKGYAIDVICEMVKENKFRNFSISASDSTVSVHQDGKHDSAFNYKLTAEEDEVEVVLRGESVSASGTYWQGNHIFDPRTASNAVDLKFDRIWVCSDSAAMSDAFSTALFLMNEEEVETMVYSCDAIKWAAYSQKGKIIQLNKT